VGSGEDIPGARNKRLHMENYVCGQVSHAVPWSKYQHQQPQMGCLIELCPGDPAYQGIKMPIMCTRDVVKSLRLVKTTTIHRCIPPQARVTVHSSRQRLLFHSCLFMSHQSRCGLSHGLVLATVGPLTTWYIYLLASAPPPLAGWRHPPQSH
jgi:hypothetical protein